MARYLTGITPLPGDDVPDPHARLARMLLAINEHPIATTAPCRNPECGGPVDYLGHGKPPLYCSSACRARTSTLRHIATDQLDLITRTLEETTGRHGIPRDQLHERVNQLRWWLTHLE